MELIAIGLGVIISTIIVVKRTEKANTPLKQAIYNRKHKYN